MLYELIFSTTNANTDEIVHDDNKKNICDKIDLDMILSNETAIHLFMQHLSKEFSVRFWNTYMVINIYMCFVYTDTAWRYYYLILNLLSFNNI